MSKVLFVEWCADDVLGGTANMEPLVELAYRRIIDLIYSTEDNLLDNDALQYATKTGAKWKQIREQLINVYQKIYIEDGYIRNGKCAEKLAKSRVNIEQKRTAQAAMIKKRNSLKEKETPLAAAGAAATAPDVANQEPNNQSLKKKKINKKEKGDFEEFWRACPRKVGKGKAEEKYLTALEEFGHGDLVRAMKLHARQVKDEDEKFIPHPATWLHQKRYFDETNKTAELVEDWPPWKTALAARIGDHNVKSYFHGAKLNGDKITVQLRFQADKIKNEFLNDIHGLFGEHYGIEVLNV